MCIERLYIKEEKSPMLQILCIGLLVYVVLKRSGFCDIMRTRVWMLLEITKKYDRKYRKSIRGISVRRFYEIKNIC